MRWFGLDGDYNTMVMDLLGPSLQALLDDCDRKFSVKTTLLLADQMISRLKHMHSKGWLHRDMKPDNWCMGLGKKWKTVFVIDFGVSKRFIELKTGKHIAYKDNTSLAGTARYASINNHLGIT